jgi:AcrR family transcriptional regulator
MRKRAEARDEVRERILQATMSLHDERGVAPTTFADIAGRAGVGQATVHRHFPTLGDLVRACGAHVWAEMRPPVPGMAAEVFAGIGTLGERLARLLAELDAFYARGALRLHLAGRDREIVPELDGFLRAVEAGVGALIAEALKPEAMPEGAEALVAALTSFPAWEAFQAIGFPPEKGAAIRLRLLQCAIRSLREGR